MKSKTLTKVLASLLAFILTFANFSILGAYANESIASSTNLEGQSTEVANANIEFDAYFEDEGAEKHSKEIDIASNSEKLCFKIKVADGYLANAKIQIKDSNFMLAEAEGELKSVQSVDTETNTVTLNQINKNESVTIKLPIAMNTDSNFNVENIDKVSNVVLEGTYKNNNGKDTNISKTINVNAKMTANASANIGTEVRGYMPFTVGDKNGVILQLSVKSNIVDNVLPVKEEKIEIEIPKINNVAPERVSLSAESTKATNGKMERAFVENVDYTYENGKVVLIVKNEKDANNIVSWEKKCEDEIVLTCIYNESTSVQEENITLKASNSIIVYDNKDTVVGKDTQKEVTLKERIGEVVTYNMETKSAPISKGYMLVEGAKNTEYADAWTVNVANKELVDSVILDAVNGRDFYTDENSNQYPAAVLYKSTKISKDNFMTMLGESGYINIYNAAGEIISTLNKDKLEYTYTEEITNIKIETSKPIAEGTIKIENARAIKAAEYSKEMTETFNNLKETLAAKVVSGTQDLYSKEISQDISLVAPKTTIKTTINKKSLSTQEVNEGVQLSIVLDTNDITNKLYKAPKVTIEFPAFIKAFNDSNIELLYGQGLVLNEENITQYKNSNGRIVVELQLSGEQTAFNTSATSSGACIYVQGDIIVDELVSATSENIKVSVLNEEENVTNLIKVSYAAEDKIIMRNSISEYNGDGSEVKALSEANTATIESSSETKTAKVNIDVVNSRSEETSNIVVLGRVPFTGNKTITTSEDLGSTFDANMAGKIGVTNNNVDIYYSENPLATKDLENTENGWTKTPEDFTKVKSYMIVFKEGSFAYHTRASFTYNIEIPANLQNGQETYSTYAVYYQEGSTAKSEEAKKVGLVVDATNNPINPDEPKPTLNNEDLDVKVTMSTSGKTLGQNEAVKEGQYVEYTVTMTNKTENKNLSFDLEVAKENAKFYGLEQYDRSLVGSTIYNPETGEGEVEGDPLYRYNELKDETLKQSITLRPNQTYTYMYTLVVDSDTNGNNLTTTVSFKQNSEKVIDDITVQNPISKGLIKLNLQFNGSDKVVVFSEDVFLFIINVTNVSGEKLSNINVDVDLPEFLTYKEYYVYEQASNYDSVNVNGKKVEYKINSLDKDETAKIYVKTETGKIDLDKTSKSIELNANATINRDTYTSNILRKQVTQSKTNITAKMTGNIEGMYVEDGQEIIYTVVIKNTGIIDETHLMLEDLLPNALMVEGYTVIDGEGKETNTETNYNVLTTSPIELKAGSSMTVKIKAKVDTYLAKSDTINNFATISGTWMDDVVTNTITYKIKDYADFHSEDDKDDTDTSKKLNTISGRVWKDKDSNGRRDYSEDMLSGVTVMLMNNKKAEFIKDNAGKNLVTTTGIDGTYRFENIADGEYVVAFIYDNNIYDVTTYKAEGVSDTENSDAINGKIKINGVSTKFAMTDIISVVGNVNNIDLGLVQSKIFDLKLDKQINTVIVQNKEGTKSYTFEDKKLAKLEIPSKYMEGTTLTIEYKMSVTNEGNVPAKVLKIVDYMPKELEFSSDINNEWYKGTDGYLYTNEFENTVIEPGETKEITLVLTKTLTEAASETINNYSEIKEIYNTLGLEDIDSVPGNNAQNEDDLSSANLIVTIKTGATTYTLLALGTIVLIGILGGGIYLIKKKVLTEEI